MYLYDGARCRDCPHAAHRRTSLLDVRVAPRAQAPGGGHGRACRLRNEMRGVRRARAVTPRATYEPVGNAVAGARQHPASGQLSNPLPSSASQNPVFNFVETAIQRTFNNQQPGHRNDWREVEGAYVLFPPNNKAPEAVVHFMGAAFVGAAPQISYRLFLEALSNRNILPLSSCSTYHTAYTVAVPATLASHCMHNDAHAKAHFEAASQVSASIHLSEDPACCGASSLSRAIP
eukprot:222850-Chlamydomonas_euryale.AAC.9